jgi:hypothetical protein
VTRRVWLAFAGLAAGMVMAFAIEGESVSTRSATLDTATELSAGVLDRVAVTSDGTVVLGEELDRVAPPEPVGSVWSLLDLGDGAVLAGTGVEGRVYRIENGRATRWAETGAVVVTSLARGEDGASTQGRSPTGGCTGWFRRGASSSRRRCWWPSCPTCSTSGAWRGTRGGTCCSARRGPMASCSRSIRGGPRRRRRRCSSTARSRTSTRWRCATTGR